MPSRLYRVQTVLHKKGVSRKGGKCYIKTEKGMKRVDLGSMVYHRGNGIWSTYSRARDAKIKAGVKIKRKATWRTHRHMGDASGRKV